MNDVQKIVPIGVSEFSHAAKLIKKKKKTLAELSRDLQESKARLEQAQRVARVGYWIWNLETDRVTWSDETFRI